MKKIIILLSISFVIFSTASSCAVSIQEKETSSFIEESSSSLSRGDTSVTESTFNPLIEEYSYQSGEKHITVIKRNLRPIYSDSEPAKSEEFSIESNSSPRYVDFDELKSSGMSDSHLEVFKIVLKTFVEDPTSQALEQVNFKKGSLRIDDANIFTFVVILNNGQQNLTAVCDTSRLLINIKFLDSNGEVVYEY